MPVRGDFLDKTEEELNAFPVQDVLEGEYDCTEYFRAKCVEAGFRITHIYPVFHQGWECDEWGAIGTKDGKRFRLETSHGGLNPVILEEGLPVLKTIKALFFGDDDAI
jgi:hypothetical protein